jgi:membrane dipeptidase
MKSWLVVWAAILTAGCSAGGNSPAQTDYLARARAIQRSAPLIDGHNDLPWELRKKAGGDFARMDFRQPQPDVHTDLPRLRAGGVGGLFFAAYVPYSAAEHGIAARMAIEQIDLIHRMVAHAPDQLAFARTANDVERIHRSGRIAAMIGIEGGHTIEDSLALLRQFYALGARYMTLTHSDTTNWADAAGSDARHGGLAPFGEEVVREMNRLGMMVDLSHVSDDAMRDALRVSEAPVIFSHSSARALAGDQPRDVPDDVLLMTRDNGGVVMINFYSGYLLPDPPGRERQADVSRRFKRQYPDDDARRAAWRQYMRDNPLPRGNVATVADHIDHVVKVAGIDHVGLGSDYDGVSTLPEGLEDVSCFPNLTAELLRRGYSERDVKKVLGGNVLRVMRKVEATSRRLRKERGPSTATTQPASLLTDLPASRPGATR